MANEGYIDYGEPQSEAELERNNPAYDYLRDADGNRVSNLQYDAMGTVYWRPDPQYVDEEFNTVMGGIAVLMALVAAVGLLILFL